VVGVPGRTLGTTQGRLQYDFLILPTGELKLNSPMTESKKEVARKVVDKLKKIGALCPTESELLANCPLFCVDKVIPGDK
jgi:hypothetical protein